MSAPEEKVLMSSTRKKYSVVSASSKPLLDRDTLRSIDRYVTTTDVGATRRERRSVGPDGALGGTDVKRASEVIPALPFERLQTAGDGTLGLCICPIDAQEPALDVPLRFAEPEEFHLPPMRDPPVHLPLARRVGALIKGSASVSVTWRRTDEAAAAASPGAPDERGAASLKDVEARAQSAMRSGGEAQAANLFTSLAALHFSYGNMEAAASAFSKALPLFERTGNSKGVAFCHNLCGLCYFRLSEYNMALVHYKKQEALGGGYVRCVAQVNMGVSYAALGELEFATQALEDALASARDARVSMLETIVFGNLGIVALRAGNMRASQGYLEQCLEQCSLAGDKSGAAVCLLLLGQVYSRIHDHTHALFYYEHAYRVGGEANLPDIVAIARAHYGISRGSAALRDAVLAEATAMGRTNDVSSIISALPQ